MIAISPQKPDSSLTMKERHDLQFHVLSDTGNNVADAYNLTFTLQDELIEAYTKLGINLPDFNGNEHWLLPIPATYVINQEGYISYAYTNMDHTQRADPTDILNHIKLQ